MLFEGIAIENFKTACHLQCAALGDPGGVGRSWSVSDPTGNTGGVVSDRYWLDLG